MRDMGIYFEPPRRQARKVWANMRLLAENGYTFQSEGSKALIERFLLGTKRPRIQDVVERIDQEKQRINESRERNRIDYYKNRKRIRKKERQYQSK